MIDENIKDNSLFDVVIVSSRNDLLLALRNINYVFRNIHPRKVVIICPRTSILKCELECSCSQISFLDEDSIYPGLTLASIKKMMNDIIGCDQRAGWYFQQFLKMAYAFHTQTQEYLIWDADTIPLNELFFKTDGEKLIFTMKSEYNKSYFDTIYSIFGYHKQIRGSFIAEHMMIDREIMKDMIVHINENNRLDGTSFFEKIVRSINVSVLNQSGFSEFETYGTFVLYNYPERYIMRCLHTGRHAKVIVGDSPSDRVLSWVSESYDIISLEKSDWISKFMVSISKKRIFQRAIKISWIYGPFVFINAFMRLCR